MVPCRCLDGHIKELYEMSMAWEPNSRSNFFFSPLAHLCAVAGITEISLIVMQYTYIYIYIYIQYVNSSLEDKLNVNLSPGTFPFNVLVLLTELIGPFGY